MSLKTLDPVKIIPKWKADKTWERVDLCRFFLKVHGFISERENQRIRRRMNKWVILHGYELNYSLGVLVPRAGSHAQKK